MNIAQRALTRCRSKLDRFCRVLSMEHLGVLLDLVIVQADLLRLVLRKLQNVEGGKGAFSVFSEAT